MLSLNLTVAPDQKTPIPTFQLTPAQGLKFGAAITLFGAGMHYLVSGRKEADFSKMITGAVLTLASLLFLL